MPVSADMKTHLGATVTLGYFVTVTAVDADVIRFWNGTRNKIISGNTFYAQPFEPSQIKSSITGQADNQDIDVYMHGLLTRANILSGKWAGARVEVAVYNYMDFAMGVAEKRVYYIGDTEVGTYKAKPELNSLFQKLTEPVGLPMLETCNAQLGDTRCTVDVAGGNTVDGTHIVQPAVVTSVANNQQFIVDYDVDDTIDDDFYRYGICAFTSGNNDGYEVQVMYNRNNNEITLFLPAPFTIAINDTVSLTAGCDKYRATCKNKYNNVINFRGFPDLLGENKLIQLP